MSVLALFAVVGGSMAIKDVFYVAAEFLVSRSKTLAASTCDIFGDVASLVTYGVGGVEVFHHGFSLTSAIILLGIAIGSLLGTIGGIQLGHFLAHLYPPEPVPPSLLDKRVAELETRMGSVLVGMSEAEDELKTLDTNMAMLRSDHARLAESLPPERPKLSPEELRNLQTRDGTGMTLFDRLRCHDCGGVHTMACPRVKARTHDGVTYFRWGEWPTENIIWPEEAYADLSETAAQEPEETQ